MSRFHNLALIFLACTLLLSSSCAPTEDEIITGETVQREGNPGVFLDSAVAGVGYSTSGGLGGFTDSEGTFYYKKEIPSLSKLATSHWEVWLLQKS